MDLEVSVVTASLNHGAYIEACIKSVLVQRKWYGAKINHIIVDGGSTDNTHEILYKYKDDIVYLVNSGEGQTGALNSAMRVVEDRFPDTTHVGLINADDFYQWFWLDEMHGQLRNEPDDVALICSDINYKHGAKLIYGSSMKQMASQRYFDKRLFGQMGNMVSVPSVLIRFPLFKKIKEKHGFYFNPHFILCGDFELWYRVLDDGYRIRHIPKLTVYLRLHPQQLSQLKYNEQCLERDVIVEWCCRDVGIPLPSWFGER